MTDFSERFGYRPQSTTDLRDDDMPQTLRSGLWDAFRMFYADSVGRSHGYGGGEYDKKFDSLTHVIWFHFFREPIDDRPTNPFDARDKIRKKILGDFSFHELYSFLEFVAKIHYRADINYGDSENAKEFVRFCNKVLERERAAFRFSGSQFVKLTDKNALEEIEVASLESPSEGVRAHISAAARSYSSDPPEYRNSIKEAISAVESATFFVLGRKYGGLREPLKEISEKYGIHPSMQQGFEKLYGYTSDKDGIRHAILNEPHITNRTFRKMSPVTC